MKYLKKYRTHGEYTQDYLSLKDLSNPVVALLTENDIYDNLPKYKCLYNSNNDVYNMKPGDALIYDKINHKIKRIIDREEFLTFSNSLKIELESILPGSSGNGTCDLYFCVIPAWHTNDGYPRLICDANTMSGGGMYWHELLNIDYPQIDPVRSLLTCSYPLASFEEIDNNGYMKLTNSSDNVVVMVGSIKHEEIMSPFSIECGNNYNYNYIEPEYSLNNVLTGLDYPTYINMDKTRFDLVEKGIEDDMQINHYGMYNALTISPYTGNMEKNDAFFSKPHNSFILDGISVMKVMSKYLSNDLKRHIKLDNALIKQRVQGMSPYKNDRCFIPYYPTIGEMHYLISMLQYLIDVYTFYKLRTFGTFYDDLVAAINNISILDSLSLYTISQNAGFNGFCPICWHFSINHDDLDFPPVASFVDYNNSVWEKVSSSAGVHRLIIIPFIKYIGEHKRQ